MAASAAWSCSRCTYLNNGTQDMCSACSERRRSQGAASARDRAQDATTGLDAANAGPSSSRALWTCPRCKANIAESADVCIHCIETGVEVRRARDAAGGGKAAWVCPSCTFANAAAAVGCALCGAGRPVTSNVAAAASVALCAAPARSDGRPRQRCPFCTALNDTALAACSVCKSSLSAQPALSGWLCQTCAFRNADGSDSCRLCTVQRRGGGESVVSLSVAPQRKLSHHRMQQARSQQVAGGGGGAMPAGGGAGAGGSQRQEAVRLPLPSFFAQEREAARRREEIVASLRAAEAAGEEARFIDYGFLEDMLRGTGYEGALALRAPRAIRTQSGREVAWRLFGDRISPFDVVQGSLGDCYLLSAFVVLAERPDLIQNLFLDVSVSRYGLYQLRFFKDGHWRIVDIDDMLPVRDVGSHKSLVFAHNEEGLLWPALLEKGYAKLHGSYGSIHAGQMHEALADLTGVPCDRLSLHAVDLSSEADVLLLWGQVLSLRESGALMGASCGRLDGRLSRDERIDSHMYRDMGLLPDHAYAVLDVRQLSERHRLIKLRNPWSRWVWNGDWGPGSKLWTPELRAQLGYFTVASDDRGNDSGGRAPRAGETDRGVFWMRFEDFLNFFSNIDFCRFRMDWHTQLFDGRFPASSLVSDQRWEVRTSRPTWAFFSLIQRDLRTLRRVGKPPAPGAAATLCDEYSAVGLVVCRVRASQSVEDETLEFHAWRCLDAKREVTCEVMLHDPDSVYVVFAVGIATPRERAEARTFVLSSYSARPLTIAQLPTTARLGARGLQLAVKQHCRSLEALNEARTVILYRHVEPGCVLLYVENRDYGSHTNLELDCSASAGLQSSRSELLSIDVIPPRHAQLLALFVPLGRTAGFSWRCSFKFSLLQAQRATASALQQHYPPFAVDDDPHRPLPLLLML